MFTPTQKFENKSPKLINYRTLAQSQSDTPFQFNLSKQSFKHGITGISLITSGNTLVWKALHGTFQYGGKNYVMV